MAADILTKVCNCLADAYIAGQQWSGGLSFVERHGKNGRAEEAEYRKTCRWLCVLCRCSGEYADDKAGKLQFAAVLGEECGISACRESPENLDACKRRHLKLLSSNRISMDWLTNMATTLLERLGEKMAFARHMSHVKHFSLRTYKCWKCGNCLRMLADIEEQYRLSLSSHLGPQMLPMTNVSGWKLFESS